jgi:SnoaL-like domain
MDQTGGQEPVKRETARLADLPVEGLPEDAPEAPYAATDAAPEGQDPDETAHDPEAERGPKAVMTAYAAALDAGDAALAADLYAENSLLTSADERISGRAGISGWHEDLLGRGRVTARPAGQGNDGGRLEVDSAAGRYVVELAFDASGRIGTARWLTPGEAGQPQEERERTAT